MPVVTVQVVVVSVLEWGRRNYGRVFRNVVMKTIVGVVVVIIVVGVVSVVVVMVVIVVVMYNHLLTLMYIDNLAILYILYILTTPKVQINYLFNTHYSIVFYI